MMNLNKNKGFTLVELMVSVAITAILMVGMAAFFSSTFRNMFMAREKVTNSQGQFVVNTILGGKFVNVDKLQKLGSAPGPIKPYAVLRNDMDTGDLPFTYIGKAEIGGTDHIVFKDFFVFNGRYGTESSFDDIKLDNPAGIVTNGGNERFVTAPLENKIYRCIVGNCIGTLNVPDLNQPMDIDIDLDGGGTLYVADAGNNRVLAISNLNNATPDYIPIATGLKYPTGVAFYLNTNTGKKYLFVADTYNHLVKRIDLSNNSIKTVVGDGDDEDCNPTLEQPEHSAIFCKLNFPTDVLVGEVGGVKSLYVADTGNGRVLKVSDPDPDLSNHKILASIVGSTQISRIDFVFPPGTTINSAPEVSNTLHKGRYEIVSPVISYYLSTTSTGDNIVDEAYQVCIDQPQPEPPAPAIPPICTTWYHHTFMGFFAVDDIFQAGDNLTINEEGHIASNSAVDVNPPVPMPDSLNPTEIKYGAGAEVKITKEFSGDHEFYFNLEDVVFTPGFNLIETKIYDESDTLNNDPSDFQTLRIGDGELGTYEDTIEVVEIGGQTVFDFPTGLSPTVGAGVEVSDSPDYDTDFSSVGYDYVSDFDVEDFGFTTSNNDEILEMKFDAKLGEDAEGNSILEENTLNSNVK